MRLFWGELELTTSPYGLVFGSDFGVPENVVETLALMYTDGEIELSDRAGNRTITFQVLVEGSDLAELSDHEAALVAEARKALNTLTLDPGNFGPVTVYQTFQGTVALARDDDGELAGLRVYQVTMRALPFARSENETITPALGTSGTTTENVNDGSSTTGWTGEIDGASSSPSVVSGAVKVTTGSAVGGKVTVAAILTTAISTSATPWLVVDWKPESSAGKPDLRAYADDTELRRDGQIGLPSGLTRSWFYVDASSVAVLRLESTTTLGLLGGTAVRSLSVDNIDRTDAKPAIGTTRQLQRTITVGGSARTLGSVAIEHETSALGEVLAYFWANDDDPRRAAYSPPLRQYRTSGNTVTGDSTLVSGARETITSGTVFDIPLQALPNGTHSLLARLNVDIAILGSASLAWSAETRVGSNTVGPSVSGSRDLSDTDGSYVTLALDRLPLPTIDVAEASTASVRLTLTGTVSIGTTITLDEAWLFGDFGQLVWADCGTGSPAPGGPSNRLFIEPATVARPRPVVRRGYAADGSDAYSAPLTAWQFPEFRPGITNALTVTSNALDAQVSLRHYDRWHSHAAS